MAKRKLNKKEFESYVFTVNYKTTQGKYKIGDKLGQEFNNKKVIDSLLKLKKIKKQ